MLVFRKTSDTTNELTRWVDVSVVDALDLSTLTAAKDAGKAPDVPSIRVCVRPASTRGYQLAREACLANMQALPERYDFGAANFRVSPAAAEAVHSAHTAFVSAIAEHIVVDWEGVTTEDGATLPFTVDNFVSVCGEYPEIARAVHFEAEKLENEARKRVDDIVEK